MCFLLMVLLLGTTVFADEAADVELFEGDVILSPQQKEMFKKNLILTPEDQAEADKQARGEGKDVNEGDVATGASFIGIEQFRWPGNKLYYDLSEIGWWGNWGLKKKIRSALKDIQSKIGNCVEFIEKESGPRVEVHTHNKKTDGGCYAELGYQSRYQTKAQRLNLGDGCTSTGTIQHEFIHSLGFFHMQARSDRDDYVIIMQENIVPGNEGQFAKYKPFMIKHFGLPFDYKSIMMYDSYEFSKNYKKTIVTKDPSKQKFLGSTSISDGDIKMMRIAYGCK